ncbi:MAG: response regulator [Desulfobacteraceae bacterium]|nr:MAG: response regulator [Desulfobacteraceae bacterium]
MLMNPVQETTRAGPEERLEILLMEDELTLAKGLQMVLAEEGYVVDLAPTGKSALDAFSQKGFDLLIADLRLPDIDGLEIIKWVKETRPQTIVIVITGYSTVYSAVEVMKMGACDYLPKPFTEDEFMTAVEGALKEKQKAPEKEVFRKIDADEEKLIQKQEVIRVLERASHEQQFWFELMNKGSKALQGYQLSDEAKAAIVSGDLNWILKHVGKLSRQQLKWIRGRLQLERW